MHRIRMTRALGLALALACAGALPALVHAAAKTAAPAPTASSGSSTRKPALHQFSGVVTAIDKTSLTVEKNGKTPKRMTFARHADMTTQGEVERDAHVTVYYRDEDGHSVAHRVVVKAAAPATSGS
jgi:hypothetical protein